ncbi:MAG: hypothetical protein HYV00_04875, partial [Deltaproteobacteria bacterium]|nr:hypothetical protein [Deltaproteobacteria bacterium]
MANRVRVVVTGIGLVTPIGVGVEAYWKAALAGTSGTQRITHFDPAGLPSQMAAVVRDGERMKALRSWLEVDVEESRVAVFALAAARMASEASGWHSCYRGDRLGVFIGTSGERPDLRMAGKIAYCSRTEDGDIHPASFVENFCKTFAGNSFAHLCPQYVTALIARTYGITGASCTIQTACTSSAQAVGEALRAIRRGTVDAAIAGGAECIVSPIEVQLFCLLGALSRRNDEPERASRP